MQYTANTDWQLWFFAQNVGWLAEQGIPGAQALRVEGIINQQSGRVSLFGENNQLLTADTFAQSIQYNQLNLDIDLANTSQ
ncbi:hypothetical protein, partial [Enterococcus faecium]|uniref:hypothetical protein n=1 Tax=Enterococcus faecium TaxID=1352 RepID=UPI0034E93814